jgi:hypothetical protein
MSSVPSAATTQRWSGRPLQAALLRAVAFVAPIAASIGFVDLVSQVAPAPLSSLWVYLLWWLWLTTAATLVLVGVERVVRRLLPLAALLKLSLVFPDQTPSRFKTAMRAGSTKNLEARMQELRDAGASPAQSSAILLELVAALNSHDRVTRGHCERVRAYAVLIGEELGLSRDQLDLLNWSALLHDVGKLSVPSEILNKPDRPDEDEWQLLKAHPLHGETLVEPMRGWLGEWADAVGYHHERWDGAGYPRGVEGESIPLPGRIVAVADVYDVITSARSYKEAGNALSGREEISRCAGSQFDPRVVRAFLGVSIGRMRLVMGPLSWLSHAPFLSQIPFGSIGSAVSGALGVAAVAGAGGLVASPLVPAEAATPPPALVRHVPAHPATEPHARTPFSPGPSAPPAAPTSPSTTAAPPPPTTTVPTSTVPSGGPPGPPPPGSSVTRAEADSVRVPEGREVVIDVLANDTNSKGYSLSLKTVTPPSEGAATVVHDTVDYTAPADWAGTTTFLYRAVSGVDGAAATGVVTVTVLPVDQAPSFVAGSDPSVREDAGPQTVSGWASQISAGPADESGQALDFQVTGDSNPSLFSSAPAVDPATGDLTFRSAPNAFGSATITLVLHDDGGTANGGSDTSAPQSFTITVTSVNDAPTFVGGADQTVREDAGPRSVSAWASQISPGPPDESGQHVSFILSNDDPGLFGVSPTVASDGTLTYTPAANASGTAHVTVRAQDDGGTANGGSDTSAPQSFTITVSPVNDAPSFVAGADQTVLEGAGAQSVSGWASQISAGPADESGQHVSFLLANDDPGLFGAGPTVASDGTLTYTPAANASGMAHVTVRAQDDGGTANGGSDTSAPQSFTITVWGSPTPQPDSFQGWSGSDVVGDLLANDTDPQGSPLTLQSTPASGPANGTVTLNSADGTFVYVPDIGFTGTDTFTYTVANGYGATATAQVTITISAPTGVTTSLVAAANSRNLLPPYQVSTGSFTPTPGATYLVFAGRVSSPGDIAIVSTTGDLDVPAGPLDATVGADGDTHGWVWAVHGLPGGSASTITVTFTRPSSKLVASDVLEVAQVGGSGIDHDTAAAGLITSSRATVALTSPGASDSELALLYVNGDVAEDPGWTPAGMATLSGSLLHSPNGTTGYGALLADAPQALASATTKKGMPAKNGNSYVSIAVDLLP